MWCTQENQSYFNHYNWFDNEIMKDKQSLKKWLMNTLDTLQDYYEMDGDIKKFPSNFTENDICEFVCQLGNIV